MSAEVDLLKRVYDRFNARDMEAVLGAIPLILRVLTKRVH